MRLLAESATNPWPTAIAAMIAAVVAGLATIVGHVLTYRKGALPARDAATEARDSACEAVKVATEAADIVKGNGRGDVSQMAERLLGGVEGLRNDLSDLRTDVALLHGKVDSSLSWQGRHEADHARHGA